MRCTALDLATLTGVAYGEIGAAPRLETWDLARDRRGDVGLALMRKLTDHLATRIEQVWIEAPLDPHILPRIGATVHTAMRLYGLAFLAEAVCASQNVPVGYYKRQDVLAHFTGKAKYPGGSKGGKIACMARCRQLGWMVEDHEQGDAAALWDYGIAQINSARWLEAAMSRPAQVR